MVFSSRLYRVSRPSSTHVLCEYFKLTILLAMSQQQPQLYNNLTSALGPEEQQIIKAALDNADKIAADKLSAAAQQSGAAAVSGGQGLHQTNGTS